MYRKMLKIFSTNSITLGELQFSIKLNDESSQKHQIAQLLQLSFFGNSALRFLRRIPMSPWKNEKVVEKVHRSHPALFELNIQPLSSRSDTECRAVNLRAQLSDG